MLIDFLKSCKPIFEDENHDFDTLCGELNAEQVFVGYMPTLCLDLWPVYALHSTNALRFTGPASQPKIFFLPIGVSDLAGYPMIRKLIREFYSRQPSKDFTDLTEKYGIRWTETILLHRDTKNFSARLLGINTMLYTGAVYMRMTMQDNTDAHLFIVCETPEGAWRNIIETYSIPVDMLIHSHKGLGDWFTSTPLYRVMQKTINSTLLPKYYFRGKFVSNDDSPEGSTELEKIPEDDKGHYSRIYRLPDIL